MGASLYVGNLSCSVTDRELTDLFSNIGQVEAAKIVLDTHTGLSKGIGIVRMADAADAASAISRLNFTQQAGRVISVRHDRRISERPG